MKSILSPYNDNKFNEFFIEFIKERLRRRCEVLKADEEVKEYSLGDNTSKKYTLDDLVNSLSLHGRIICYKEEDIINHLVYDLGQRLWYDELKSANNLIFTVHFKYYGYYQHFSKYHSTAKKLDR